MKSVHSVHCTECTDFNSALAARYLPRAALPKVCAASERRRQSISTCEGRCRTNVLSAWNVVPSSAATGLSPVVHPPSRPMDLQSPQRTSVETCLQTRHGEHVVENWSLRLKRERDRHAGRPSCNGHGLDPPRTLAEFPSSSPEIVREIGILFGKPYSEHYFTEYGFSPPSDFFLEDLRRDFTLVSHSRCNYY